jgi:hypothetical protein
VIPIKSESYRDEHAPVFIYPSPLIFLLVSIQPPAAAMSDLILGINILAKVLYELVVTKIRKRNERWLNRSGLHSGLSLDIIWMNPFPTIFFPSP